MCPASMQSTFDPACSGLHPMTSSVVVRRVCHDSDHCADPACWIPGHDHHTLFPPFFVHHPQQKAIYDTLTVINHNCHQSSLSMYISVHDVQVKCERSAFQKKTRHMRCERIERYGRVHDTIKNKIEYYSIVFWSRVEGY